MNETPTTAHFVECPPGKESASAWVAEAREKQLELEGLCGVRWMPLEQPADHPACEACLDAFSERVRALAGSES